MSAATASLDEIVAKVRAIAEATPNPCEGSRGHMRDDFAWQAEEDLRQLNAGAELDFTADDLRDDCVAAIDIWEQQDAA